MAARHELNALTGKFRLCGFAALRAVNNYVWTPLLKELILQCVCGSMCVCIAAHGQVTRQGDHVGRVESAIIDFAEAAYDLELSDEEWLPRVIERGLPVLDHGLGVAGMRYGRPPEEGPFQIFGIHVASGPADFAERHTRALATTPPEVLREQVRPGGAGTASVDCQDDPQQLAHYTSHVNYCKDILYLTAVDCKGSGVAIVAPLPEVTTLTGPEAERWQMLAAHVDSGHRLRQGLSAIEADDEPCPDLPHGAEAIFDANSFRLSDAVGPAQEPTATAKLRDAAVSVDRARGKMRDTDPERALEIWKALVRGRWSTGSIRTADALCWRFRMRRTSRTRAD
jgi:hypothetical protein